MAIIDQKQSFLDFSDQDSENQFAPAIASGDNVLLDSSTVDAKVATIYGRLAQEAVLDKPVTYQCHDSIS